MTNHLHTRNTSVFHSSQKTNRNIHLVTLLNLSIKVHCLHNVKNFTINIPASTTIHMLKNIIYSIVPPDHAKLSPDFYFNGEVLADTQIVGDIFGKNSAPQLVVKYNNRGRGVAQYGLNSSGVVRVFSPTDGKHIYIDRKKIISIDGNNYVLGERGADFAQNCNTANKISINRHMVPEGGVGSVVLRSAGVPTSVVRFRFHPLPHAETVRVDNTDDTRTATFYSRCTDTISYISSNRYIQAAKHILLLPLRDGDALELVYAILKLNLMLFILVDDSDILVKVLISLISVLLFWYIRLIRILYADEEFIELMRRLFRYVCSGDNNAGEEMNTVRHVLYCAFSFIMTMFIDHREYL